MNTKDTIYHAFHSQKHAAKKRGIEWHFTFEEWVTWWETHLGKDWLGKRGRRYGQYCMARFNDTGPYAVWNVKCVQTQVNTAEIRNIRRGEDSCFAKLTASQAAAIRKSKKHRKQLAKEYNVSYGAIYAIQTGRSWRS